MGSRNVTFSKELYIERSDFMIEPVKKYYRLYPGNEVRLKSAYIVKCTSYETDENGNVTCVHCTYDPETRAQRSRRQEGQGTIHWVNAKTRSTPRLDSTTGSLKWRTPPTIPTV